jgi:hypothetical protein
MADHEQLHVPDPPRRFRQRAKSAPFLTEDDHPFPGESWRQHVYEPLDHQRKEIRFLLLMPASTDDQDPEGWLFAGTMDEVSFSAVSYVWGDPTDFRYMMLNGRRVKIGRNAHAVLRNLRRSAGPVWIWIDALCINQADFEERGQQVGLMREIYSTAEPVVLWLGEGSKRMKDAFSAVAWLADQIKQYDQRADDDPTVMRIHMPRSVVESILYLFQRNFWTRLWIAQEVALGNIRKQCVLVAGTDMLSYTTFWDAMLEFGQVWQRVSLSHRDQSTEILLELGKSATLLAQTYQIFNKYEKAFELGRSLQATDPKDRVYGFLGIMPPLDIQVDYKKTIDEVYVDATYAIIKRTGSLKFILLAPRLPFRLIELPSWTVDWRSPRGQTDVLWEWSDFYSADGGATCVPIRQGQRLAVKGHKLGTLDHASQLGPEILEGIDTETASVVQPEIVWRILATASATLDKLLGDSAPSSPNGKWQIRGLLFKILMMDIQAWLNSQFRQIGPPTPGSAWELIYQVTAYLDDQSKAEEAIKKCYYQTAMRQQWMFFWQCIKHRRLALAHGRAVGEERSDMVGHVALVPSETSIGDCVYILQGSRVPLVLRPIQAAGEHTFQLLGAAYVEGCMDGEVVVPAGQTVPISADVLDSAFDELIWLC